MGGVSSLIDRFNSSNSPPKAPGLDAPASQQDVHPRYFPDRGLGLRSAVKVLGQAEKVPIFSINGLSEFLEGSEFAQCFLPTNKCLHKKIIFLNKSTNIISEILTDISELFVNMSMR